MKALMVLNYTVNYHVDLINEYLLKRNDKVALELYYSILSLVRGYYYYKYISYDAYRYFRNRIIQIKRGYKYQAFNKAK